MGCCRWSKRLAMKLASFVLRQPRLYRLVGAMARRIVPAAAAVPGLQPLECVGQAARAARVSRAKFSRAIRAAP